MQIHQSRHNDHTSHPRTISFLIVSMLILASPAFAQKDTTNLRLIAAMPKNCESVMVLNLEALQAENSIYRNRWRFKSSSSTQPTPDTDQTDNLGHRLKSAAIRAEPLFQVLAGSDFSPPGQDFKKPLIGGGKYTQRGIWMVRQSLADFEKSLKPPQSNDSRESSNELVDGFKIYQGKTDWDAPSFGGPRIEKDIFVAFADERAALYASSRDELVEMLHNWRNPKPDMPPQWAAAAGEIDLEAARILILRRFDRTNAQDMYSPVNPRFPREVQIDIDSISLAITDVTKPDFTLNVLTKEPERALPWLSRYWLATVDGDTEPTDKGLRFNLQWRPDAVTNDYNMAILVLYYIFGMNIVI